MDLLETIARSLAEELKPPTGTTILYVESTCRGKMVEHGVVMYSDRKRKSGILAFITVGQSNVRVTCMFNRYRLNYNDPELLDRLQKILDEAAQREVGTPNTMSDDELIW